MPLGRRLLCLLGGGRRRASRTYSPTPARRRGSTSTSAAPTGLHRFDYHRRCSAGSRLALGDIDDSFLDGLGMLHLTGTTLAVSDILARGRARPGRAGEGARDARLARGQPPARSGWRPRAPARRRARRRHRARVGRGGDHRLRHGGPVELARLTAADELVVTRGAGGAVVVVAGAVHVADALPVDPVDPAGAGRRPGGGLPRRPAPGDDAGPGRSPRRRRGRALVPRPRCALSYPDKPGGRRGQAAAE